MRHALALIVVLALAVPGAAPLAADSGAGLKKCAGIADSLKRLVCYDELAKEEGGEAPPVTPTSASATAPESSARQQYSSRCQATTKKGTQCKRNAKPGSNYCWQHGG